MNILSKLLAACFAAISLFSVAHAAPVTGNIAVYQGTTLLGYVRNTFDGQNSYTYGTLANALTVQIDPSTPVFDILALNGPDAAHPYVGAVGGSNGYYFQSGSLGYAYLSGTGHTNAGSPPSFSAGHSIQSLGYNAPAESMIWSHSGDVLLAQWINTDGTANPTQTFYSTGVDFLGLVGDLARFDNTFPGEGAFAVTLRFTGDLGSQAVPEPASLVLLGVGLAGVAATCKRKQAA